MQIVVAFVFGLIFVICLLVLAVKFPKPTPFQYSVFRITLSLAAAGVAAMIPGFINLEFSTTIGLVVRAGGALAVFAIVFFFNPAQLKTGDSGSRLPRDQVAAVCFQKEDQVARILLVRTTGGRWTFPKGNVDAGEEEWFAAQREAFEEAGVVGEVEHDPFVEYFHEKREWKSRGREILIFAFLLKVENTQEPEEENRNPTWFTILEAGDALAEGRRFKYAEEFRKVLRVAESRIALSGKQV